MCLSIKLELPMVRVIHAQRSSIQSCITQVHGKHTVVSKVSTIPLSRQDTQEANISPGWLFRICIWPQFSQF